MAAEQNTPDVEGKLLNNAPPIVLPQRIIGNPGPLGLTAFALTTFVLSLHNGGAGLEAMGPSNVVVGLAFFYGGAVQLLAGMWEFATGNTFGATAFSSYGGFWMSYALIFIPSAGITEAYDDPKTLARSLTIYLIAWAIVTFMFLVACHRASIGMVALFFFLFLTFVLLAAAEYNNSRPTKVSAGAFGVITAVIAWYNALSGLLTKESSFFMLPVGNLP